MSTTTGSHRVKGTISRHFIKIQTTNDFRLRDSERLLGPVFMGVGEPQVGEVTRLAVVEIYNAFTYNLTTPGFWGEVP